MWKNRDDGIENCIERDDFRRKKIKCTASSLQRGIRNRCWNEEYFMHIHSIINSFHCIRLMMMANDCIRRASVTTKNMIFCSCCRLAMENWIHCVFFGSSSSLIHFHRILCSFCCVALCHSIPWNWFARIGSVIRWKFSIVIVIDQKNYFKRMKSIKW